MGTTGNDVSGCGRNASGRSGLAPGGSAPIPLRRCLTALATALALPVLAACGSEARGAGEAVVRDSAGVTIVENQPDAEVPLWTVGPEPVFEVGGDTGDPSTDLFRVRAARRLPDGRIIVANGGTQELRYYDAQGTLVHTAGGEGEGPGEFQNLYSLLRLGEDSLATFDFGNRRVSVFDLEGEYARSFPLELPGDGPSFPWVQEGTGPDGRQLVLREGAVFGPGNIESGLVRDSMTYYLADATGEVQRALGTFLGSEAWVETTENMIRVRTLPLGRSPQLATGSSGFYQSSTDRYDIGYYGLDGTLRRRVRLLRDPRPLTDADLGAYRTARLEQVDEEARSEEERSLREMPHPETMPAHGPMQVDVLDHLWVQEYRPSFEEGSTDRWRIYDPEGRQVATAELPSGAVIYEIGEDYVLGRWQDEFDLEYVRLLRLERTEDAP